MIIKVEGKEYQFKDEPTTRDLMTIGMFPAYYKENMLIMKENNQKGKDEEKTPIREPTTEEFNESLLYNAKILTTFDMNDIEDWLDMPRATLLAVLSHKKMIDLIGKLYG